MADFDRYIGQSPFTDPGAFAPLLDAFPTDPSALAAVVRDVFVPHVDAGIRFGHDRRWLEDALAADKHRHGTPLESPRPIEEPLVGTSRDLSLLVVAALRHRGVPARSRVGFAGYLRPGFFVDHVVAQYWNGTRWVTVDADLDPARDWPFDPVDVPLRAGGDPADPAAFVTAAQVWAGYRRGEVDADRYRADLDRHGADRRGTDRRGADPDRPLRGGSFVRDAVLRELAHLCGDELLLRDEWGIMGPDLVGDLDVVDEVAALLVAADEGSAVAERELVEVYATDRRVSPGRFRTRPLAAAHP